ncbi:hypothetical protein LTR37_015693 [Vermiconidia calcicola]|uniref:Uncharacterized protein n=1 Tax=Vermiconidia calcicola TaxID=1690605 RepID=A0ACC3MQ29_9PEZI|nr:hypothetical protein LTR37_015693 [Vermiconidia calcicola]
MAAEKIQILPLRRVASSSPSSGDYRSSESESPPHKANTKKSRTSKPKVRSGCVTCKIRRVKCDETKPECNRCTSTGRKCDGYVVKPRKKRSDCTLLKVPDSTVDIGPAEPRALGFFHQKTAPSLSSYFDADFWTRLVFQMSYAEPSIRHAMIALGTLHEQREHGLKTVPLMSADVSPMSENGAGNLATGDHFAIAQYNKAITFLSKRMSSDSAIEIALLACILFVCIEFLRGDPEPAVKHFKSGMTIALASLSKSNTPGAASSLERIKEHMLPFFNRIELLSTLFGNDASWNYPVELPEAVPDEFRNMREARDSIVHIANLTIRFIRYMKFRKYNHLVFADDLAQQQALLRQMEVWSLTLDKMLLADTITDRDLDAAKTLRIHRLVAAMWLRKCTIPEECGCDQSMTEFETTVSLAEAIQSVAGTRDQRRAMNSSTFLFDMEIVSPLYYVAGKCRHPVIRRRALAVLKKTQRREGLWDSNVAAAVAERVMHIEEANLTFLDGNELPDEKSRIHNSQITSETGTNRTKHDVTFHTKPNGMDGHWKIWKERIVVL